MRSEIGFTGRETNNIEQYETKENFNECTELPEDFEFDFDAIMKDVIDPLKLEEVRDELPDEFEIANLEVINTTDLDQEKKEIEPKFEKEKYFSTYDERIKQTPRADGVRGEWEGERGESKFIPNDQEIKDILFEYGLEGIDYKDGIPDFSDVSESTVEIDNMTDNRAENFKQCDQKCADQWSKEEYNGKTDWTARDVAQWRKENGYSWHERNDMKTCDLVPTKINDYFGHLGGVSECKARDSINDGGDFDE